MLLSLGSTSAVANVIAGVVLTYTRSFRPGDYVCIDETNGAIVERSMFVTQIRTRKNELVSIPNSAVLGSHIVNYSAQARSTGLILHTTVTIGYDVPFETVENLLIEAARRTSGVESEPEPFVLQRKLDDFYVHYELNATTRDAASMPRLYSELHRHIQETFAEAGIEIMSPHIQGDRDANRPVIPDLPHPYSEPKKDSE